MRQFCGRVAEPEISRWQTAQGKIQQSCYAVFPGIDIIYHDVHADRFRRDAVSGAGYMEIRHCRQGRMEYCLNGEYHYLAPGDMTVTRGDALPEELRFPTGHYHGITVRINLEKVPDCLSCFLQDVEVRPAVLMEKFCQNGVCFAARSSPRVEHVFSELYSVPEDLRKGYFKVKVLELLLFLSALPAEQGQTEAMAYSATQVMLAHKVRAYLLAHREEKVTVSELAERFGVSASQLKNSFQGVYGQSPAAYLRLQKMHAAAQLLRETNRTVLDIAGQFGYDNGSKFAKAFRDVIGVLPNQYRCGIEQDSCAPGGHAGV